MGVQNTDDLEGVSPRWGALEAQEGIIWSHSESSWNSEIVTFADEVF